MYSNIIIMSSGAQGREAFMQVGVVACCMSSNLHIDGGNGGPSCPKLALGPKAAHRSKLVGIGRTYPKISASKLGMRATFRLQDYEICGKKLDANPPGLSCSKCLSQGNGAGRLWCSSKKGRAAAASSSPLS